MASISIRWERRAVKELRNLGKRTRRRVVDAVEALRADPLRGQRLSGEWKGLRRLRVGEVRVIYGFDGAELSIAALRVGKRHEVNRR